MSLRVAIVHSFYRSGASGENTAVRAELAALSRAGATVRLVSAHGADVQSPLGNVRAAARVATQRGASPERVLRSWKADIVHVHNLFPSWASRWMSSSNAPVVATLHNYRPFCANGLLLRNGRFCSDCLDGSPLNGLRHACYRGSRLATLPLTARQVLRGLADPYLRAPRRLLLPSDQAADLYLRAGLDPVRLRVSAPFLPDDCVPQRPSLTDRTGFAFVGRLSSEKGLQDLLPHWPADERLVVAGDGPLRPALERMAAPSVRFVGTVSRQQAISLMLGAEGLLFPSAAVETFGLVYLEALAAATPVIARTETVVGGLVLAQRTGTTASQWHGVRDRLETVRAGGEGLRARCREVFQDQYAERVWASRRLALYEEVVGETN